MSQVEETVSDQPRKAPKDYQSLPARVTVKDGDGLYETWHGSGVRTATPCGNCGNVEGNKQIFGNWGCSYPNGNSWDDKEIVCGSCGKYTYICKFTEG